MLLFCPGRGFVGQHSGGGDPSHSNADSAGGGFPGEANDYGYQHGGALVENADWMVSRAGAYLLVVACNCS